MLAEEEASLYLQARPRRVWAARGQPPVVTAEPGRATTSFYGTLNLRTGADLVMRAERMTARPTAEYLEQVLAAHPHVPVLLLWARAPWQRGEGIREGLAAHPRLERVQLAVAAPDLNPHEHGWKATREAVSHNHSERQLAIVATRFDAHRTETSFPTAFLEHRGFYTVHPRSI